MRRHALLLAAFAVTQALLLGIVLRDGGRPLRGDEVHYQEVAGRLAAGQAVTPLFLHPPGYEWGLALLRRVAGPGLAPVWALQALMLLGTALLLRHLLLRAGLSPRAADAGALLLVADPQVAAFAGYLWPEVPHLLLLLGAVALLTGGRPFAGGVVLGLTLLVRSLAGPFVPVLLAAAAWTAADKARAALRALAGLLLVTLPVVAGQGLVHGYWGIADSSAFNVWVGLRDPATRWEYDSVVGAAGPAFLASSPDPGERNRLLWQRIRQKLAADGLAATLGRQVARQYGRLFDRESFFTDQLRGGRWRRAETSGLADQAARGWGFVAWGATLTLATLGLVLWDWRARWTPALLPACFLAYNLALFLLLHVKTRYRVAMLPALLFFAAAALDRLGPARPARRAGGVLLAVLALLLAFGDGCPPRHPQSPGAVGYPLGP